VKKLIIYVILWPILVFILQGGILFPKTVSAMSPFTFTVTQDNNWGTGFCYQFTTENTSANPVADWVVWFDLWGGTLTSTFWGTFTNSWSSYEIRTPWTYADPMAPGQSVNMWFCWNGVWWISNLALTNYIWMWIWGWGWTPPPWSTLQDYSITFEWLQIEIETASNWATGYCRDISIENTTVSVISNWELDFSLDQTLSSSYSATFIQTWTTHNVSPLAWNTNINPAQTITIGFCSNGTSYDYDWTTTVNGLTSPLSGISDSQIGTGSVTGSGAFDAVINWDDNFPGTASGSVENILIKARVEPSLNMEIDAAAIDLGTLVSGTASTGSLSIEVGTNAVSGLSITARSQSGGLTNTTDSAVQINTLTPASDPVSGESYTWASTVNATDDSSFGTYTAVNTGTNGLDSVKEITENTTEYNVYTTNKPEATPGTVDDVTFDVSATAQAETPAGDYEDRVTFTVTGNF
jgi:hypothetical protein